MARHKPKFGHRPRHPLNSDGIRGYTDDQIEGLAREYAIDQDQMEPLREHLELAAQIWRTHQHNYDEAPKPGNILAALDVIEDSLDGLCASLENLDEATAELYWRPHTDAFRRFMLGDESAMPGHPAPSIHTNEDGSRTLAPTQDDIIATLALLKAYCGDARRRQPVDKGGERQLIALNYWAENICRCWEKVLSRDLGYSKKSGSLMAFAADTHRCIAPTQAAERVMNAVQRYLDRSRR